MTLQKNGLSQPRVRTSPRQRRFLELKNGVKNGVPNGVTKSKSTPVAAKKISAKKPVRSEPNLETVMIPDIFESFLSRVPTLNPHYEKVYRESVDWSAKVNNFTELEAKRQERADLPYFAAISYPDADAVRFRTCTDWFNWIFPFDDQLDDMPLGHQREEANAYIDGMAAVVNDTANSISDEHSQPARYVLKTIWLRMLEDPKCSTGAHKRWAKGMMQYFGALRDAVVFQPSAKIEDTIERYVKYRYFSIAVTPMFAFIEFANSLNIPDEVFECEAMHEIERVGVELQMLANDCISYHRERDLGCPHNLVHLMRHHGLSEQETYDRVQGMIRERYRDWYLAFARLPIWGEEVDRQVHTYLKGVENIILANANWSFRTQRYYGKHSQKVRETRLVEFAPSKADWIPPIVAKPSAQVNGKVKA